MEADSSLGARLMELRKRKGMSMRELAEQSGTSTSLISQIETGRTNPTVSKLQNLANRPRGAGELLFRFARAVVGREPALHERYATPLGRSSRIDSTR